MLSRLLTTQKFCSPLLMSTSKRWSGHNTIKIEPSNWERRFSNNWIHFYVLLGAIPCVIISAVTNIYYGEPVLSEIPEGYEPRFWEYQKRPITRWISRYLFQPQEREYEIALGFYDTRSEAHLVTQVRADVEEVMNFYHDHRTRGFRPWFAELTRLARDKWNFVKMEAWSDMNYHLEGAYKPDTPVPVEGFKPTD